jgi:hypothetical protein
MSEKALRSFFMEPVQHLWVRIQHLDEQGTSIPDINYAPTNPILECRQSVATLIFQPIMLGPMAVPFEHYSALEYMEDGMISYTRSKSVSIDSQAIIMGYLLCSELPRPLHTQKHIS